MHQSRSTRRLIDTGLVAALLTTLLRCGPSIEPLVMGKPVCADDGSEIACALNRCDFDNRPFANHCTNSSYDIVLYDTNLSPVRTVAAGRQVDGYESEVEALYYMRSAGYLLVQSLLLNGGGRVVERMALDGSVTRLFTTGVADPLTIWAIPSARGTTVARVGYSLDAGSGVGTVTVSFVDAATGAAVGTGRTLANHGYPYLRWRDDSLFQVLSGGRSAIVLSPYDTAAVTDAAACVEPQTSSSVRCPGRGFLFWNDEQDKPEYRVTVYNVADWCLP